MKAAWLGRC